MIWSVGVMLAILGLLGRPRGVFMNVSQKRILLLALLALGLALAMVTPARADEHRRQESSGDFSSLQVVFSVAPHWVGIRGTNVWEIRSGERPDYDMYRCRDSYYVFSNDRWYWSRRQHGQFRLIDERAVPRELSFVPRDHWRRYPRGWINRNVNPRPGGREHDGNEWRGRGSNHKQGDKHR